MKVGYMTNAWGSVVGHCAGVTSIKDLYYLSTGDDKEAIAGIAKAGFELIEIFDGNLMAYENDKQQFQSILDKNGVKLFAVYCGADFIYDDILEDELYKMKKACLFAKELGAKHAALGGGAIRSGGIRKDDHQKLAAGLDKAAEMIDKIGLIPSYHPHLGTIVQAPEQLDILMGLTDVNLCPDCAHIEGGGGSSVEVVKKYADRIKYIHLKDFKDGQFLPLGMGEIDFKEIVKTLSGKGVDYTVEVDGYPGDPYEGAVTSYRYLEPLLK